MKYISFWLVQNDISQKKRRIHKEIIAILVQNDIYPNPNSVHFLAKITTNFFFNV